MRKSSFLLFLLFRKMKKFRKRSLTKLEKSSEMKYAELCRIAILFRRAVMQKLKKRRTAKNEKSENALAAVFEKAVISPYDENEENDKLVYTVFLDR